MQNAHCDDHLLGESTGVRDFFIQRGDNKPLTDLISHSERIPLLIENQRKEGNMQECHHKRGRRNCAPTTWIDSLDWDRSKTIRQAKDLLGNYNTRRSRKCIRLSKDKLKTLLVYVWEDFRFREHLERIRIENDVTYKEGMWRTPHHQLVECGSVMQNRASGRTPGYQINVEETPNLDSFICCNFKRSC